MQEECQRKTLVVQNLRLPSIFVESFGYGAFRDSDKWIILMSVTFATFRTKTREQKEDEISACFSSRSESDSHA